MKNTKTVWIIGSVCTGLAIIAAVALVSTSSARAESPNILVGRDLTVGSSGSDVVVLQGLLAEQGYLDIPATTPLGYFGALTKAAVARYQAAHSVGPAAGYFGPVTKSAVGYDLALHGWRGMLGW